MKKDSINYKEAMSKIEVIVENIENNEPDIDELGDMIKEALMLIKICKVKLKNTELELNKALEDFE